MGAHAKDLLVLGSHIMSVEIADVAEQAGWHVAGFVENLDPSRCDQPLEGRPVHWVDRVPELAADHVAVFGLGTTLRSRFIEEVARLGLGFATVVHPSAVVSPRSEVGEGSVVGVHTAVGARSQLGRHVLLNRGAMVGHHTEIGDYVSVMPGAQVAGVCSIGEGTWIGMGAVVIDRVKVGRHSVIGAGAMVTADLPDHVMAVGVPARVVREGIEGK